MGKIIRNGISYAGSGGGTASSTIYDNTTSDMAATDVQGAIDELNSNLNMRYNSETDMIEIYYNGEWVEWALAGLEFDGVLYENGNYNTEYFTNEYIINSSTTKPTIINAICNNLKISYSQKSSVLFYFNKTINLSKFNNFVANITHEANGYATAVIGFSKYNTITDYTNLDEYIVLSNTEAVNASDKIINISDLKGDYYLYIYYNHTGAQTVTCADTYHSFKLN